jgi:hypothetical protein
MKGIMSFIRIFPVHKPPKHESCDKAKCFGLEKRYGFLCVLSCGHIQVVLFFIEGVKSPIRVSPGHKVDCIGYFGAF